MMTYEAIWPLRLAKRALAKHVFSPDLETQARMLNEVQEALDFALLIIQDHNEAENEAYDVGWQSAAKQLRDIDWDTGKILANVLSPRPYNLPALRAMVPGRWLWVEPSDKHPSPLTEGAYVQAPGNGDAFLCRLPDKEVSLSWLDYGYTWLAYPYSPRKEGQNGKEVHLQQNKSP